VDLRQVGGRSQVLWQAGTAEGKSGPEIGSRDVELRVLADQIHDLEGIDAERVAKAGGFIGEGDLEGMEIVATVFHHLGRTDRGFDEATGQLAEQLAQALDRKGVIGTDDGKGRLVVIANRRAFAQKLRLEAEKKTLAVLLSRLRFDDRPQYVLDRTRHQRRAEDDDVRRALAGNCATHLLRQTQDCSLILAAVGRRRRTDANQGNLAVEHRALRIGGHCDAAAGGGQGHQVDHALLDHRCLAGHNQVELGGVDIDADHLVAIARQTGQRHRTDVAQAEDADFHAIFPLLCEKFLMQRSMIRSSLAIECGQAWLLSMRCLPASASRCRSAGLSRIRRMASEYSSARVGNKEMCHGLSVDTAGSDPAGHHRHAHRHRLENLVLRAAGDVERRHHQRRLANEGTHVGHRAGDGDARQLAQFAHRGRGVGTDDQQLDLRPT
jgi:hypothetical protein